MELIADPTLLFLDEPTRFESYTDNVKQQQIKISLPSVVFQIQKNKDCMH